LKLPTDSPVACVDLRGFREASGHEVFGIIGMNFLGRHVFRLDPDRGELVFLSSVENDPGTRLPISIEKNTPQVEAVILGMGRPEQFLVDTGLSGYSSGTLTWTTCNVLSKAGRIRTTAEAMTDSASGRNLERLMRVESMTIGTNRHKNLLFGEGRSNVLGLNYWLRYIVTFDFPNKALYLKRGRRFDQPDLLDFSGLHIYRAGGKTLVLSVEPGSPAASAGLSPHDVIVKVGSEDATGIRLHTQCEAAVLASFGMFCGDFMAMAATAKAIARMSGENQWSGRWCKTRVRSLVRSKGPTGALTASC
jgi:hypothetical protein